MAAGFGMSAGLRVGYKQTEVGVIPADWEIVNLRRLSDFITSGSRGWARYYADRGALFVRSQNIRDGRLDFLDRQFVNPPAGSEGDRTRLKFSDFLITITGNSVGNVALVEQELGEAYISQHVGLVRLSDPSRGAYIFRFLAPGSIGNHQIFASQSGQSKPGLSLKDLQEFLVALPPVPEQRAIAAALSDVDALLGGLDRLIAKKQGLKVAAMQQLLTGQTRLPGFSGEWEVKRLGELAEMGSGGTPLSAVPAYYDGKIPWVSISDMTKGGKIIESTERNLTALGLANSAAQIFPVGTVLYAMYASLGECSIAGVSLCTSQAILGIRPKNNLNADFLYYYLTSLKSVVKTLGQQGTQSNLNKGMVQDFRFSLPSVPEQTAIAAVLSDMDTELAALQARRSKTQALKQAMMQELLSGKIRLVEPRS